MFITKSLAVFGMRGVLTPLEPAKTQLQTLNNSALNGILKLVLQRINHDL